MVVAMVAVVVVVVSLVVVAVAAVAAAVMMVGDDLHHEIVLGRYWPAAPSAVPTVDVDPRASVCPRAEGVPGHLHMFNGLPGHCTCSNG